MSAVVLSDEEIEAQRQSRLAPAILTPSERDAINADFASVALERETNRQDQQARYDRHKGRT